MTDDHDSREELQRIAYGRGVDDGARDAAARRLRELDHEALRRAALVLDTEEPAPARARPRWILPAAVAAALAVAVAMSAGVMFLPGAVRSDAPVAKPTSSSTPRADPSPGEEQGLEERVTDLQDMMPVDPANLLAERSGCSFYGKLSETFGVCVALVDPQGSAVTDCTPAATFGEAGATLDRGSWSVTWMPDGSVVWEGLA